MINRIDGFVEDKTGRKYLSISDTDRNNKTLKNAIKYSMELNIISKK